MRSIGWTGLLGASLLLPALALERPSGLDTDLPLRAGRAAAAPAETEPVSPRDASGAAIPESESEPWDEESQEPADRQTLAYLGLAVSPVPEALAVHLGLPPEKGVLVRSLDPKGPAAVAGVKRHDILRSLDGEVVGSRAELQQTLSGRKPGEPVELALVQEGNDRVLRVELGSRPAPRSAAIPPEQARPRLRGGDDASEPLEGLFDTLPQEQAERIRRAVEENLRLAEEMNGGFMTPDGGMALGNMQELERLMLEKMSEGMPPEGSLKMSAGSSVRLFDKEGSVELEVRNGEKEVRVRDREGKIVWEGPYQTEADKAAVPDDIRHRVDRVDLAGSGSGFHFRFDTGPDLHGR